MRYRRRRYKKQNNAILIIPLLTLLCVAIYMSKYIHSREGAIMLFFIALVIIIPILDILTKILGKYLRRSKYRKVGFDQIYTMSGTEFEYYLDALFSAMGYKSKHTGKSNDYGADLILTDLKGNTICLQAKRYTGKVGIKAVQEVVSAKEYYGCKSAIVVTNSYFTSQAINLAQKCGVQLWDKDKLYEKHCSLHMKDKIKKSRSEEENKIN